MSTRVTREQTIVDVRRLGNSVNGNPSYRVTFADGSQARTGRDSAVAFEIPNAAWLRVPARITYERGVIVAVAPA